MAGLGERLREAREQRGLTLDDVEASTRIRKAYLAALEAEDYASLPHPTFVKGFIRTYAALLGLRDQEMLDLYPHRDLRPTLAPVARLDRPGLGAGFWVASVTLFLVVAGLATFLFSSYSAPLAPATFQGAPPAASPEQVLPTVLPAAAAVSPTRSALVVSLPSPSPSPTPTPQMVEVRGRAVANSWLWVIVDSTPVFTGTLRAGEQMAWTARDKVFMRVGNAGGMVISHNGQDRGVLGKDGQVLDVQWTRDSMSFDINPPLPGPR